MKFKCDVDINKLICKIGDSFFQVLEERDEDASFRDGVVLEDLEGDRAIVVCCYGDRAKSEEMARALFALLKQEYTKID